MSDQEEARAVGETLLDGFQATDIYQTRTVKIDALVLQATEGAHRGSSWSLKREETLVGRADWCDVSLPQDQRLSRHHCELRWTKEGMIVRDKASRNGVFLNDIRIKEAYWRPDQILRIGDSALRLLAEGGQRELRVGHFDPSGRLVGSSEKMRELFSMLSRLSPTGIPLLLLGETGTGKTSIARALHDLSPWSRGPFVQVNCGAIAPNLMESEFFGYEKGAFTGAAQQHLGLFEQADGGTLFLDEIGELPLSLQPKLLDVLERQRLRRLGGKKEIPVSFRLISATHQDLREAIRERAFREDLYYRLAVMELSVPPLRERASDIPLLAAHLLAQLAPHRPLRLSAQVIRQLQRLLWPGNVRELRNTLHRSLLLAEGEILERLYLDPQETSPSTPPLLQEKNTSTQEKTLSPPAAQENTASSPPQQTQNTQTTAKTSETPPLCGDLHARLLELEQRLLEEALAQAEGDQQEAIRLLGISQSWFYKLLKKHHLHTPRKYAHKKESHKKERSQ